MYDWDSGWELEVMRFLKAPSRCSCPPRSNRVPILGASPVRSDFTMSKWGFPGFSGLSGLSMKAAAPRRLGPQPPCTPPALCGRRRKTTVNSRTDCYSTDYRGLHAVDSAERPDRYCTCTYGSTCHVYVSYMHALYSASAHHCPPALRSTAGGRSTEGG